MADKEDELGALWVKNGARGDYMTGTLDVNGEKVRIVAFREGNKRNEKAPDWRIYKSKPREQAADPEF